MERVIPPESGAVMAKEMLDPVGPDALTRFAQLAARVLDVPLVHISLIDAQDRSVESRQGVDALRPGLPTDMRMPLVTWDGRRVGTLSVKDPRPRRWSAPQIEFLKELSVRIVGKVDIGPPHQMM